MIKSIKKIILGTVLALFISASTSFAWWEINYVVDGTQVVPAEHTIGFLWMPDTFYNDFTK